MTIQPDLDAQDPVLLTDMGNARRFAMHHKDRVRYVTAWGWVVWDGRRWKQDDTGGAVRLARCTIHRLFVEAQDMNKTATALIAAAAEATKQGDEEAARAAQTAVEKAQKKAKALMDWAVKSQSRPRIDAMLALAQSEPELAATTADFDNAPWLLNALNGTVDLRTGNMHSHSPDEPSWPAPTTARGRPARPGWPSSSASSLSRQYGSFCSGRSATA